MVSWTGKFWSQKYTFFFFQFCFSGIKRNALQYTNFRILTINEQWNSSIFEKSTQTLARVLSRTWFFGCNLASPETKNISDFFEIFRDQKATK